MSGWRPLLPILLLVLATAGPAAAAPGPRPLNFDFLRGYVELGVRGRNDSRTREGAGTDFSKDQVKLDEILHLGTAGSVWYPRLLRFTGSLDLHFMQEFTQGDNLFLPGGDLRINFLEKKPYGLSLFGRVAENEVEETFGRNFETRLTTYGGAFRFLLGPLPFTVRYRHLFQERTGDPEAELQEETDEIDFRGNYRLRAGSDGDVRYIYSDQTLRGQPSQRHDFTLNNITYFDRAKQKRFTGIARYYQWEGRTDTSEASLRNTFDWRHTKRLRSRYHFDYSHRTFDVQSSDIYSFGTSIAHQLYGSLSSSAGLSVNIQDATSGMVGEYGVDIQERYMKRLGRWGRINLGLSPFVQLQQLRPREDSSFVVGESVTFSAFDRAMLNQQDIDVSTIVVSSPDRATVYQEGFDYTVNVVDRRTELIRIDTGIIPAGGQVLVDYRFQSRYDNDLVRYGFRGDFEWSYRDWGSLFVDISTKREELVAGFSDRRLDDRDRQEFGFKVNRSWYRVLLAFDWERWSLRSADGNLQTVSLMTPWRRRWRASVSVTHRSRDFTNPIEELESWRVYAEMSTRVGKNGFIDFKPEYASEIWEGEMVADGRDLESVGGTLSLRWYFRALEFRGSVTVRRIVRPGVEGMYDNFFFRVRRYF
jgi:hypothetical protein